ncbi:MAG: SPOR domain-containing protein [Geminicoccales bacterium]
MRLGRTRTVSIVGLSLGTSLALSGCSTVGGAVDDLGRRVSVIMGLVNPAQPELEANEVDRKGEVSKPLARRAGTIIASQQTKRLSRRASEPAPSSTSSSSQELNRIDTSPQDLATTTTGQGGPKIELAAVPSITPAREEPVQGFRVQVAAVRDEADAHLAWDKAQTNYRAILAGREPLVVRAETSKGIIYRIQTGPFQTRGEADQFCTRLKERGAICFVVAD